MSLDELTAPADVDWSEIRSATEARDWRRAWQAVGTDHVGDATPGEAYLLSKAARAKATAAALVAWRKVEMDAGTIFIGADAARVWERIKRIAGWTSQARAQYASPKQAAARHAWNMISTPRGDNLLHDAAMQARLYGRDNVSDDTLATLRAVAAQNTNVRPASIWIDEATLDALRQRAAIIDDPVDPALHGNGRGVVGVLNNPFLSAAANRGEITGTVTIPPSTSRSIAAMLATQARLTGGARLHVDTEDESITITPSSNMIRWQRPALVGAPATNPNPRGPQPRRRSRT